jgi:cyclopropane fatty-acyl-phospholipid synthase-like methyltransferase
VMERRPAACYYVAMKQHRLCPWWLGYLLASPLRGLLENPGELVRPYIREGMTVLEPGPGMGFFTVPLARLVGAAGRVIAVEVQLRMLAGLKKRLAKAGLLERVDMRLVPAESMQLSDLAGAVDYVMALAVVHEMPSAKTFFTETAAALKKGGQLLLAEPTGHVTEADFEEELKLAGEAGLTLIERPAFRRSRVALFAK